MINNLAHSTNYTQQTTIQQQSNTARPATQVNSTSNDNSFAAILTLTESGKAAAKSEISISSDPPATSEMLTNKGNLKIDLDSYFSNNPTTTGFLNVNDLPPLFMPSAQNINTLTEHISTRFKQMLADYNISSAPEKITFDNEGNMQIPIDYPYADELNQALEENTGISRELRTVNALSSHYVEIQERMPFIEEMGNATSKAEIDRIIAKYSHLLHDNNRYKNMALIFSKEGSLSVMANGEPVKFG